MALTNRPPPQLAMSPPPTPGPSTLTLSHLTYPTTAPVPPLPPSAPPAPPQLLKDRLYVGNLHPSVDEYTLLNIFTKHGKVSKLDFLFHKTGPAKGRPRGYAFVEYVRKEDALRALVALHDRLVRGRKLVVTFAHQAPHTDPSPSSRRPGASSSKPTTLSLLKTHGRPEATKDKIAALEAKLRQMEAHQQQQEEDGERTPAVHVLPSSLPQKPLISPAPSVPAGGVQRKVGGGGLGAGSRAGAGGGGVGTGGLVQSKSSPAPKTLRPPSLGAGHRYSSTSLGIAIKR